jgi:cephalosporin-C deacetylase-like acetyl esterase
MPLTQGVTLGPYEIQSLLGAGGMGEVYLARDTRLQRTVAIKILPAHLSSSPDLHARFVQEAKSISSLQHPNICVVHDIGSQDSVDYMVMEYVSGQTLDHAIPKGGLPPSIATRYAIQVADALAHAHAAGIVHRDLKPANIMIDDAGFVKVLDFGLAKLAAAESPNDDAGITITGTGTTPGLIVGTLAYMSPEQAEGKPVDVRTDIFSFGAVFYEMLTGRRAFDANSSAALLAAVMRDDPKPVGELRRDVPSQLRGIVTRCLKKDPAARYPSGAELLQELKRCRELLFPDSGASLSPARIVHQARHPRILIPLITLVVLIAAGAGWLIRRNREIRWAREVGVPEVSRLYDEGKYGAAFALATRAEKAVPNDPALAKLWPVIAYAISIDSTPEGAAVYRREYSDTNAPWEFVGNTPLKGIRQPRGMFLWKLEKPGYSTVIRTTNGLLGKLVFSIGDTPNTTVALDEVSKTPAGMMRVSPASYPKTLFIPGFEGMPELSLPDYWIDQYEVTNRQYKAFVDAGGYQKPEYWKFDFLRDGKKLTWDEAMAQFRDAAGRPGPRDWIQSGYARGQDDYPVTGISWYEAAAYAEFVGKSLPTIYHWNRASGPFSAAFIVPLSNFGSTGIVPVGSRQGVSPWGNYDMAGNVKEWTATEAESDKRWVLGGAWDEPNYMFVDPDAQSPWLRASNIGFRTVKYLDPGSVPQQAFAAVPSPRRDFSKEKPVSDQVFQAYRSLYSYDKTPLNPMLEQFGDEEDWKVEKVTYAAGYGNERASAYLFLPKKAKPPYQTILFFPGSNALLLRKFAIYPTAALDGILRSGRAVIYPIYKSTYERGDGWETDVPDTSNNWRDHVAMWVKDASRALDYVDTRPDLDHQKIGYYGYSWGAVMGAIIPAVDSRIQANVLALGGMEYSHSLPEVDKINFLPRVKQPTLMLNGHYDFFFPVDSTQIPFYNLLGPKKDQKKRVQYETGHNIPRNELIKEMLKWYDLWLGPVQ